MSMFSECTFEACCVNVHMTFSIGLQSQVLKNVLWFADNVFHLKRPLEFSSGFTFVSLKTIQFGLEYVLLKISNNMNLHNMLKTF